MSSEQAKRGGCGGQHAVVIGASMAGLLGGRVLSDHFERVTIIERDRLAEGAEARKGVPQGRHVHGLLSKGAAILKEYFPDLFPALVKGGIQPGRYACRCLLVLLRRVEFSISQRHERI